LRLRVALAALDALGQGAEADRHRAALQEALPDTSRSYLPLDDGRHLVIGTGYLLSLTDEIAGACLQLRHPDLGNAPLLEWPGLLQTSAEVSAQRGLVQSMFNGEATLRAEPATLLAAALLAWDAGQDPARVLAQLRRALQPTRTDSVEAPTAARVVAPRGPLRLAAAFHDRAALRRAVVLGAALGPRPRRAP
jgi:hypothetical protein